MVTQLNMPAWKSEGTVQIPFSDEQVQVWIYPKRDSLTDLLDPRLTRGREVRGLVGVRRSIAGVGTMLTVFFLPGFVGGTGYKGWTITSRIMGRIVEGGGDKNLGYV